MIAHHTPYAMSSNHTTSDKVRPSDDQVRTTYGPVNILIADDEHLVVASTSHAVTELGHVVAGIAVDGEAALAQARQTKPDLALLDIRMPKLNGIDLARALMTELGVPSIIISAYSDQEHVAKIQSFGTEAGVFGYLIKPVNKNDLRVAIGVALQRAAVELHMDARINQLETILANRRAVEQAKWIVVKKRGWDEPTAHTRLQEAARNKRRPLIEIAMAVIATGDLAE